MGTLNFLSTFSLNPSRFFGNPGVVGHPQLSVCLFTPPPLDFLEIQVEVQEWVGTFKFLCALSPPPPIFYKSKWQIQEEVGTQNFLCSFSLPPPFFGNRGGSGHPQIFVYAFAPPLTHFLEIEVASPGVAGHLQHSVRSFTPSPNFLEIEVEVQELVGTLKFLCDLSHGRAPFFGNRSGSRRVVGHPQLFLSGFSPPAQFFLEIKVANPGVHWHPQLSVCFFNLPPRIFWKSMWQIQEAVATLHFLCSFSLPPPPHFLEIELQVQESVGTVAFCALFHTPLPIFFWKSKS